MINRESDEDLLGILTREGALQAGKNRARWKKYLINHRKLASQVGRSLFLFISHLAPLDCKYKHVTEGASAPSTKKTLCPYGPLSAIRGSFRGPSHCRCSEHGLTRTSMSPISPCRNDGPYQIG